MSVPVVNSTRETDETARASYARLLRLYEELETELISLQSQGKLLEHQAQTIIDKQKMLQVLQNIRQQP